MNINGLISLFPPLFIDSLLDFGSSFHFSM
ncbi:hypothetical protein M2284_000267 [Rhodococcus sp. LBL1]|nr:hypothetical protein [Rhodococcus sp. LBL1]MDH6681365.1 hypothetical protein [Rhodococcus sp. LBL2]